jgi:hypothetical protein
MPLLLFSQKGSGWVASPNSLAYSPNKLIQRASRISQYALGFWKQCWGFGGKTGILEGKETQDFYSTSWIAPPATVFFVDNQTTSPIPPTQWMSTTRDLKQWVLSLQTLHYSAEVTSPPSTFGHATFTPFVLKLVDFSLPNTLSFDHWVLTFRSPTWLYFVVSFNITNSRCHCSTPAANNRFTGDLGQRKLI